MKKIRFKIREFLNKHEMYYLNIKYSDFDYWLRRTFKYFWQRGYRGWAENDTWGLDSYLTKVIYESIDYLASYTNGYPGIYKSFEEWQNKLKEVSQAFKDYEEYSNKSIERLKLLEKEYNIEQYDPKIHKDFISFLNKKEKLPSDVYQKYYIEEDRIFKDIKDRMKTLIDIYEGLWD